MVYHAISHNFIDKDTYINQACEDSQTKH